MGTNGFQEPAVGFEDGPRSSAPSAFSTDGKFGDRGRQGALHGARALARPAGARARRRRRSKFPFLINNGRANHVWQSAYLDSGEELVMDRWPYPFIEMHPDDMAELGLKAGDLVEVYNDAGSTQAMVQPSRPRARRRPSCCSPIPTGVQGNVVNAGINELVIPNYKQTWANIRKLADAPAAAGT